MEEEIDSSEEGEVSNEEAGNESTAFQQHEHMTDLFTTSCLDELDYDESVDESENDEPTHLPSHWEPRIRRESELVVEDVGAEEGEIMSDEGEGRSPPRSRPVSNKQEASSRSPIPSPLQPESKKPQAPSSPPPSTFPNQWEKSTSICRHFLQGRCSWGESCRFLHEGIPDEGKITPPHVPRIRHSHSPVDFSSQSHPPHLRPSPHPPHLHPSPRPPNMAASPFKQRGYGMPPVMNEFARGPPPFASEMIPGGGHAHFPHHDFPPHAFGRPRPPWPPPPPSFHGQPVAGVGPHKEEENDGWLRLRPIIPGWDSDEDQPIDQTTTLKRRKDLPDTWETESDDDKHSKRKKRKKSKRSKSPAEVATLLENEWVDPWARKPSKPKSEEPKGGRCSDEAEEKKKKKKKKKSGKNKKDKELPPHEKENERNSEKTSVSLRSNEEEDVVTPENTSPLSGGWVEERSQQGKRLHQESYQTSTGWCRDISPDFDELVCFDEEGMSSTLHASSPSPPPVKQQRREETRTGRERKKSARKHAPASSDSMLSRQDQLLQELEKVNKSLERKKSKRHHKH